LFCFFVDEFAHNEYLFVGFVVAPRAGAMLMGREMAILLRTTIKNEAGRESHIWCDACRELLHQNFDAFQLLLLSG